MKYAGRYRCAVLRESNLRWCCDGFAAGESLRLVGESGSGKTMMALALMLMGLLPPRAKVSGEAQIDSTTLVGLDEKGWRTVRGREIAMVFQEPMTALNPVMRIGAQIEEAIRVHASGLDENEVRRRVLEALQRAAVPEPETRIRQFPHQLSGGLRQRAMIVESGPVEKILRQPANACTRELLAAVPEVTQA
jgi:ABC-type dipeptide/oligopeptide/nickel transport system ATPase component